MLFRRCALLLCLALLGAAPVRAQDAPKPDAPKLDAPRPDAIGPLIHADQAAPPSSAGAGPAAATPAAPPASPAPSPAAAPAASKPADAKPAEAKPEKTSIVVFGDSQGEGVATALHRLLRNDPNLKVRNFTKAGTAISQELDYDWPAKIAEFVKTDHADIAVMMFGGNDRLPARVENGRPIPFRSDEWKALYEKRVAQMADSLTAAGIHVIWCGDPVARDTPYRNDMEYLNGLYQEALAGKAGVEYLPLWTVIADPQGNFVASGKALDGTTQKMRLDDGIHFTPRGYDIVGTRILAAINVYLGKNGQ